MAIDNSKVQAARRHVEDIRQKKFSIGAKVPNPLTQDLHNAVTRLSSELYTKDIHFLMELIQVIMPLFFSICWHFLLLLLPFLQKGQNFYL